jgi:hypothetical protein
MSRDLRAEEEERGMEEGESRARQEESDERKVGDDGTASQGDLTVANGEALNIMPVKSLPTRKEDDASKVGQTVPAISGCLTCKFHNPAPRGNETQILHQILQTHPLSR